MRLTKPNWLKRFPAWFGPMVLVSLGLHGIFLMLPAIERPEIEVEEPEEPEAIDVTTLPLELPEPEPELEEELPPPPAEQPPDPPIEEDPIIDPAEPLLPVNELPSQDNEELEIPVEEDPVVENDPPVENDPIENSPNVRRTSSGRPNQSTVSGAIGDFWSELGSAYNVTLFDLKPVGDASNAPIGPLLVYPKDPYVCFEGIPQDPMSVGVFVIVEDDFDDPNSRAIVEAEVVETTGDDKIDAWIAYTILGQKPELEDIDPNDPTSIYVEPELIPDNLNFMSTIASEYSDPNKPLEQAGSGQPEVFSFNVEVRVDDPPCS